MRKFKNFEETFSNYPKIKSRKIIFQLDQINNYKKLNYIFYSKFKKEI
jgi:hypothetical protein